MAKWGEGDPRWVVENRDDGKNVNNWHWTSTSKLSWAKERLGELFLNLQADVPADKASLTITGIKQVTGEASVTIRKGNKKLVIYDLTLSMTYEGQIRDSTKQVTGEFKVEDISNGSEEDEYIYTITVEGIGSEQDECKKIAEGMKPLVVKKLQQFVVEMCELGS